MKSFSLRDGNGFRFWVLGMLLAASFLNYFDRQTASILKTTLKGEFHMDDAQYALMVNVFMGCFAFAYLVSGWVVDKLGPRLSLTIFAALWSGATIGCGAARNFTEMAIMRGLLGLAEPGFQPVSIRAGAVWSPPQRRGLFLTLCGAGSSLGAIAAPPLIALVSIYFHWRLAFVLPGLLGFAVAAIWWFTYHDPVVIESPGPAADQSVLPVDPPLTWPQLWCTPSVWGILAIRFLTDPVWYFCLLWFPGYLQEHKGATLAQLGFMGWLPFVVGSVGSISLAALTDFLGRRTGDPLRARKGVLILAACLGPLCMLVPLTPSLLITILLFCLIVVMCNSWLAIISPVIADAFPIGNVASIWGMAGAFGAVGTILFNYIIGHAAQTMNPDTLFIIMGLLHPCAAVLLFAVVRRVKK